MTRSDGSAGRRRRAAALLNSADAARPGRRVNRKSLFRPDGHRGGPCPVMGWPGRAQRLICWTVAGRREATLKEHAMRTSQKPAGIITTIGIDLGKNTFHLVGFDQRGVIILQQKVSRAQLERRL